MSSESSNLFLIFILSTSEVSSPSSSKSNVVPENIFIILSSITLK